MVIIPNVHFSFRKGGGSAPEVLYGKVELKPTLAFQASTSLVLPAPTTIDLVDGEGTATNVYPTPAPVEGQIEWAYRVKVTDRHSKSFEWMVGVPDVVGTVEFTSLPKYYETRPPAFGKGDKGDPGTAATVAVGSVTSGTTPNVTNSGTNTDAVFDFVLQQGPQGPKGDGTFDEYRSANGQASYRLASDAPNTYPKGFITGLYAAAEGWPHSPFTNVITFSGAYGASKTQIATPYNGVAGEPLIRYGLSSTTWSAFKPLRGELSTTTANGLMSSADKLKLDQATPYNLSGERLVRRNAVGSFNVTHPVDEYNPATKGYVDNNFVQAVDSYEVFVDPTLGSDTNSGSSASPFKTLKAAIDFTMTRTVKPDNVATIHLASGTYRERIVLPDRTPFPYVLHIKGADVGGHPNVPTTVFSEGDGTRAICFINRNQMARVILEDIKFHGYNGTSSSGGATNVDGNMKTVNCHFDRCYYGVSSFHGSLEVRSGLFTNNGNLVGAAGSGAGIRSMMHNRHTIGIQNAGERSRTPVFENNVNGIIAQENSTGHADYCTFLNNSRGISCNVASRVNATGSYFEGNVIGCYGAFSSNFFFTSDTTFIVSGSQKVTELLANSTVLGTGKIFKGGATTAGAKPQSIVSGDYSEKVISDTSSTPVFEATLAANWFREGFRLSGQGCLSVKTVTSVSLTSGSAAKRMNVRHFGLNQEVLFAASESGNRTVETEVRFVSPTLQIVEIKVFGNLINPRYYMAKRNVNMATDQMIRLDASVDNSSESITINYSEMYSIF